MAEAVGLAASAITLAALFNSCVECFSYFRQAQKCPVEAEKLLVLLDCEKARLLVWGNEIGILRAEDQGRSIKLADPTLGEVVERCITQIIKLLTNAEEIQSMYGGRQTLEQEEQRYVAIVSVNSMNLFKTQKRRFFARVGSPSGGSQSWISRLKWAINDQNKFRILLSDLKNLVDNLIQLTPVSPEIINETIEDDISTIVDIESLKMTEYACEEGYRSWSEKASVIIKESEIGTLDRRTLAEIYNDEQEPGPVAGDLDNVAAASTWLADAEGIPQKWLSGTFMVLTDSCLDLDSFSHCEADTIGDAIASRKDLSFAGSPDARWNLGYRVEHETPYHVDRGAQQEREMRLQAAKKENFKLPNLGPLKRIFIYVGPCACAIRTALELTTSRGISEYYDFVIRVDDRLTTSCRRSSSLIDVMFSIREVVEKYESSDVASQPKPLISCIDCPSLEKRMVLIEQELQEKFPQEQVLQRIFYENSIEKSHDIPTAATLFVTETKLISPSLETRPFRREARKPRDADIIGVERVDNPNATFNSWKLQVKGSYFRSESAKKKQTSHLRVPSVMSMSSANSPTRISVRSASISTAGSDRSFERF